MVPPLAAASRLLEAQLTPADVAALERVLAAEANRLLAQAPATGSPRESSAVENAAAGECLAWAAADLQQHKAAGMTMADALRCAFDDPTLPAAQVTVASREDVPCR